MTLIFCRSLRKIKVGEGRFLVDSPDQAPAEEPINMIVNWEAELKK
jgi:hypothetical protein